jgi:peptidoglycan/LPS O-acetylase OafA/YrhL
VEEQFYLLWPVTLFLFARSGQSLRIVALGAAGLLTMVCWGTLWAANEPADLYTLPTTWASAMAIGGAASLWRPLLDRIPRTLQVFGAVAGSAILIGLSLAKEAKDSPLTYIAWPTVIAVATVFVILQVSVWTVLPTRMLLPALWLGVVSYAAYLWNLPIRVWLHAWAPDAPSVFMGLTIPLTIAAAVVSWFTVEWAGRALRARFDRSVPAKQAAPLLIS